MKRVRNLVLAGYGKQTPFQEFKHFFGCVLTIGIGVRSYLMRRGVCEEAVCPICQEAEESILHALRDCPWAKAVWTHLGRVEVDQLF